MSDDTPREPEDVRLIDANGKEHTPTEINYLGPDPEMGTHVFEAVFRVPGITLPSSPRYRIGKMPGMTTLQFRVEVEIHG
jgi:hypothetical protein